MPYHVRFAAKKKQGGEFVVFESTAMQMIVMFVAMAMGYLARKTNVMNDDFDRGLSDLVLGITLPCMIIGSVLSSEHLPGAQTIGMVFGFSCAAFLVMFLIAFVVPFVLRLPVDKRGVYRYAMIFGNVGFIGIPVLSSIFGPDAVLYVAILNIPFNVFVFTIGLMLIAGGEGGTVQERLVQAGVALRSPATLSSLLAVVLALLGITHVPIVGDALETVGDLTVPAALLIVGSSLAKMPLKRVLSNPHAYLVALVRVALVPAALLAVFSQFIVGSPLMLGVIVITNGMPVATNGTLFCVRYGGDLEAMTQTTFISTVLSLVSIPLFAMLIA